jgi:hypothetical protein
MEIAIGGLCVLVGWLLGWAGRRKSKAELPYAATCGCGHVYSMHEAGGGKCNAEYKRPSSGAQSSAWVPCPCLKYDGPESVNALMALPPS